MSFFLGKNPENPE